MPLISVDWTSLGCRTQLLRAGAAETHGVPGNEGKNWDLNENVVCVREEAALFLHGALLICSLCRMLGQPGACETQEDAGRGAGTAGAVGETAHPLPPHGLCSTVRAGRWHLPAVQA